MGAEVHISTCGRYIECRVTEPITTEVAIQFRKEVDALGQKHNISRYLFDVREAKNVQSDSKNYDFAYSDLDKSEIKKTTRMATLLHPDDRSHDFVILAMQNAGYVMKAFTDEQAAVAWLTE